MIILFSKRNASDTPHAAFSLQSISIQVIRPDSLPNIISRRCIDYVRSCPQADA